MAAKKERTSASGIPDNLKPLAGEGRVRFHGGWLNNTARDRYLADWINRTPEAWTVMKAILYQALTGGGLAILPEPEPVEQGNSEAARTLLDFDD